MNAGITVAIIAAAATTTSLAPDEGTLRRAREFEQLVRSSLPVPELPASERAQPGDFIDAGRGPIPVHVPVSYDGSTPMPLVILLHGYTNTGPEVESWMQFASVVDEYEFLYIYPTGTTDFLGNPFWNATDACCDLFGSGVDDAGYLHEVIAQMHLNYNVDPNSIHFAGHSNGGFMSYRMACDYADVVASIASLAGATYLDPGDCTAVLPVHTLQMHGTADGVIDYDGGCVPLGGCYPGAVQTAETWANYDGCSLVGQPDPNPIDIDGSIPGDETVIVRYDVGCLPGGSAELWTINGGPHSPTLSTDYRYLVIEWLLNHAKPGPDCPADIDGSGDVGVNDFLELLAAWGPNPGHPADLDGDGAVGITDFLVLLAEWGPCS
jgi:polyhydroxybutyrate depolymerase